MERFLEGRTALVTALVFGHRAATSADPNDDATRDYERRAHSIVELERGIALGVLKTPDNIAKAANADAWPAFKALREKQINSDYWKKRSQILQEQEKMKTKSTRLDTRQEFISNFAMSLQISAAFADPGAHNPSAVLGAVKMP